MPDDNDPASDDYPSNDHRGSEQPGDDTAGPGAPPRRDRRRLEHEVDELSETVAELRGELDALRAERPGAPGGPPGGPADLAELHRWLYRDPTDDDDPGGDIPALQQITSEHTAALEALSVRKPVLPCWSEMDRDAAAKAWTQLVDWLCGVLIVRYPASARNLRPCWYLHPELVENLSWLHNAWTLAYRDGNSPVSLAADWHLYWLPHVMRVASETTRKCYDAGRHDPSSDPDLTADNAVGISGDLTAYVTADLRNRPDPDDDTARGYVVPPVPPFAPQPWAAYRRRPTAHAGGPPPPGPPPSGPPPAGAPGGAGPNPCQPH